MNWKVVTSLLFCFTLVGCSTTSTSPAEDMKPKPSVDANGNTDKPDPIEKPIIPQPQPPIVEPEVKPEPKPEVKPKPKPLPIKTADGELIFGVEESIYIPALDKKFNARVDTNATTSSISTTDVVQFERDGKAWVKFKIEHGNISSEEISLPVLRWAKVKQAGSEELDKRPVVTLWIEIGELKDKADFTLTDSKKLLSPVLLGRNFFRDVAVVDTNRKFVQPK